jgi:putative sterol carrier protein
MHELLLGTLPLGKALLFRKLKVSGSKSQAMKLESLLHACQSVYPDIAADRLGE